MAEYGIAITVEFMAWDTALNVGKTGDSGNFTLKWVKDGTAATPTNSCSQVDATNAPGVYKITLTATETSCSFGMLCGKSATANVVIIPVSIPFYPGLIGTGARQVTLTIRDTDSVALDDVAVWINDSNDITGAVVGPLNTNPSGEVVFNLSDGTYYAFGWKEGYNFLTSGNSFTVASGSTAFTLDLGYASAAAAGSSDNYADSFLTRYLALIRENIDEPTTSVKYSDTSLITRAETAYANVLGEINRISQTQIVAKYSITATPEGGTYILPYTIGNIWAIYSQITTGVPLRVFYHSRSRLNPSGRAVWVEGNELHVDAFSLGSDMDIIVEYTPSGTAKLHNGVCEISADGLTVTFGATPYKGSLDTHPHAYSGATLRILAVTGVGATGNFMQERIIGSYNHETREATLNVALDPVPVKGTGGYIYYEIAPAIHKGLDGILALYVAYEIASIEGNYKRSSGLMRMFSDQRRHIRLNSFYTLVPEAGKLRTDNYDNSMYYGAE